MAAGHYDRQQWKLAVEEFRTFVEKYPNDRRANECVFFLGEALLQLGNIDEARQQFQTLCQPRARRASTPRPRCSDRAKRPIWRAT